MSWDAEFPDGRHYAIEEGTVFDNVDPKGLGRVRVYIPGLCEPATGWAFPASLGGGGPQVGGLWIPPKGATVTVWFKSGDIDQPRYMAGHYGLGEAPTAMQGVTTADVPKIRTFETPRFMLTFDDRAAPVMYLRDKESGDEIQISPGVNGVQVSSPSQVAVIAPAQFFKGIVHVLSDPTVTVSAALFYPDAPSETLKASSPKRMVAAPDAPFMVCKSSAPADMNPTQQSIRGTLFLKDIQDFLATLNVLFLALQTWAAGPGLTPVTGAVAFAGIVAAILGPPGTPGPLASKLATILADMPDYLSPNLLLDDPGEPSTPPTITGISVTPSTKALAPAGTQQITVMAHLSTGGDMDVTDKVVSWSTTNPAFATVNLSGLITAVADGTATITATFGAFTGTCVVTVSG